MVDAKPTATLQAENFENFETINDTAGTSIDHVAEKELLRKCDLRVLPPLFFLFLLAFLDRTNIGNARIAGLQKDLKLTNGQYNAAQAIFFVSYSVFEPVSNVLLKRFKPSRYIPAL